MQLYARLSHRAKDFLFADMMTPLWRQRLTGQVLCLLYHRVEQGDSAPWITTGGCPLMTPQELRTDVSFLRDQGARFFTFSDLLNGLPLGADEFGVVVSFDDGFADNYRVGLPVLEALGIRGVICQSSGLIGASELNWEHTLYWFNRTQETAEAFHGLALRELDSPRLRGIKPGQDLVVTLREDWPVDQVCRLLEVARRQDPAAAMRTTLAQQLYPDAQQLREAVARGHEIGSHGHHHYKRANLDTASYEADLIYSLEVLEGILGTKPTLYSYPFNSYLPDDSQICSRHVQQVATVDRGLIMADTDPLHLPRCTWPGPARSARRRRRWLLTGTF